MTATRAEKPWAKPYVWIAAAGYLIWGIGAAAQTASGGGPFQLPSFITGSTPPQTPQAPPPWSGTDGASGHPLMTAQAIRDAAANFDRCLANYWPEAAKRGITADNYQRFTQGLTPDLRIMDLLDAQPEFTKAVWDYIDLLVTDERMQRGRELLAQYKPIFDAVEKSYGVDRYIIAVDLGRRVATTRPWAAIAAWCARRRRSPASAAARAISRTNSSRPSKF